MPVENMEIVKPAVPRVSPAVCLKSFNMFSESFNIPSGKRLHISYGKSPCFMGKSTINIYQWAIFNSYVADQRISRRRFSTRWLPAVSPGPPEPSSSQSSNCCFARSSSVWRCQSMSWNITSYHSCSSCSSCYITKLWLYHQTMLISPNYGYISCYIYHISWLK